MTRDLDLILSITWPGWARRRRPGTSGTPRSAGSHRAAGSAMPPKRSASPTGSRWSGIRVWRCTSRPTHVHAWFRNPAPRAAGHDCVTSMRLAWANGLTTRSWPWRPAETDPDLCQAVPSISEQTSPRQDARLAIPLGCPADPLGTSLTDPAACFRSMHRPALPARRRLRFMAKPAPICAPIICRKNATEPLLALANAPEPDRRTLALAASHRHRLLPAAREQSSDLGGRRRVRTTDPSLVRRVLYR
jgi:hypothetical protein